MILNRLFEDPLDRLLALLQCCMSLQDVLLLPLSICLVSVCANPAGTAHAAPDPQAPSLTTRAEPEAPWMRLAVSVDLLALAFDEYRAMVTYGVHRFVGVRLDGAWRRDETHRIGVGAGIELWPLGRGVDG